MCAFRCSPTHFTKGIPKVNVLNFEFGIPMPGDARLLMVTGILLGEHLKACRLLPNWKSPGICSCARYSVKWLGVWEPVWGVSFRAQVHETPCNSLQSELILDYSSAFPQGEHMFDLKNVCRSSFPSPPLKSFGEKFRNTFRASKSKFKCSANQFIEPRYP